MKKRVTAIRVGLLPGLYDQGDWVDYLEKINSYFAEEFNYASDKKSYKQDFFQNEEEYKEILAEAERISTIENLIYEII